MQSIKLAWRRVHAPEGDEFGIVAHLLPRPDAVFSHRAFERRLFVFAPVPAYRRRPTGCRRRSARLGRLGRRRRLGRRFRRRSFLGGWRLFTTTRRTRRRRGFLLGRHLARSRVRVKACARAVVPTEPNDDANDSTEPNDVVVATGWVETNAIRDSMHSCCSLLSDMWVYM